MNAYEQVHKAYIDSLKNNFWDAWGVVAHPEIIYGLRSECLEQMTLYQDGQGVVERVYGLMVIPRADVEKDKVYIVDEELGRKLLGQTERGKR